MKNIRVEWRERDTEREGGERALQLERIDSLPDHLPNGKIKRAWFKEPEPVTNDDSGPVKGTRHKTHATWKAHRTYTD